LPQFTVAISILDYFGKLRPEKISGTHRIQLLIEEIRKGIVDCRESFRNGTPIL